MTATPITPERLSEIAELCEAATPGPWIVERENAGWISVFREHGTMVFRGGRDLEFASDAAFIAASRTAIPELIAEIALLHGVINSGNEAFGVARSEWKRQLADLEARIDALATGLCEACDQVALVEPDFDLIDRLRALADGGQ